METIYCQGCGIRIQTTAKNQPGFTPASSMTKENILCQRCFRLKHYNEIQDVAITDDDFFKMVSSIRDTSGLVVHVVDIFDVAGSLIKALPRIVGNKSILLVGNKVDLLPKSVNTRKLLQWLRAQAKQVGVNVADACLISSTKGHGISELAETMEQFRNGDNVYIVGTTNVGKSTFINRLIKESTGYRDVITTSYFPGTTLGFIEVPLDNHSVLIDTPGIVNKEQMAHYISAKDLKLVTPNKEIKPRVYQLNDGQTLFFGGLARLDFIKGDKQSFVCYFSNQVSIHRTKLEKADELFENHLGELLTPPSMESIDQIPPMISDTFRIDAGKYDIVFPGLGWVSILGDGATVTAHRPKGVAVSIRQSFN